MTSGIQWFPTVSDGNDWQLGTPRTTSGVHRRPPANFPAAGILLPAAPERSDFEEVKRHCYQKKLEMDIWLADGQMSAVLQVLFCGHQEESQGLAYPVAGGTVESVLPSISHQKVWQQMAPAAITAIQIIRLSRINKNPETLVKAQGHYENATLTINKNPETRNRSTSEYKRWREEWVTPSTKPRLLHMFFPTILCIVTVALLSSGHPTESTKRLSRRIVDPAADGADLRIPPRTAPDAETLSRRIVDPAEDGADVRIARTALDAETLSRRIVDPAEDGADVRIARTALDAEILSRRIVNPAEDGTDVRIQRRTVNLDG
ncbi:hypothetical protein B0H11DRAFT_2200100 [Mycena galericulata]|nr:hypothetical protein B0H11DRAFT_2200100 [Mycena galericulata]